MILLWLFRADVMKQTAAERNSIVIRIFPEGKFRRMMRLSSQGGART
jgi:hypothetical protein